MHRAVYTPTMAARLNSRSLPRQEESPYRRQHAIGRLDEDGVLQPVEDDEFGAWHRLGDQPIEPRIAAAIQLTSQHLRGRRDLVQPRAHFGFRVDIEYVEKDIGGGIDNPLLSAVDVI